MAEFNGKRRFVVIDGVKRSVYSVAQELGVKAHTALRRYERRRELGMEISLHLLAKPITGIPRTMYRRQLNSELHKAIRQYMKKTGKEISELGKHLGITSGSVSRVIAGGKRITPQRLNEIAEFLMLTDSEERNLHKIAARNEGWKV